jgi:hypothetical protein
MNLDPELISQTWLAGARLLMSVFALFLTDIEIESEPELSDEQKPDSESPYRY